jgi:elongator complex protein 2
MYAVSFETLHPYVTDIIERAYPALILAVGGTYRDIDIWTSSDGKVIRYAASQAKHSLNVCQFTRAVSLSGHEDWVRSLAFLASSSTLVLASGSQDNTVRLWNVELSARPEVAPAEPALAHTGLLTDEVLASFEASFKDAVETEDGARHLSLKRHRIATKSVGEEYVTLSSLLQLLMDVQAPTPRDYLRRSTHWA